MRYVTRDEIRELDRRAIEAGTSASALMDKAGEAIANNVKKLLKFKRSIWIFCGYGNNGGDGFAAGAYLNEYGYRVTIFLTGKPREFTSESRHHYERIPAGDVIVYKIEDEKGLSLIAEEKPSLIIDAVFGIGFRGELDDFYKKLFNVIDSKGVIVVSADIPSGLDADTGEPRPTALKADRTVTFGYQKKGFANPKARMYTGEIVVADIGI